MHDIYCAGCIKYTKEGNMFKKFLASILSVALLTVPVLAADNHGGGSGFHGGGGGEGFHGGGGGGASHVNVHINNNGGFHGNGDGWHGNGGGWHGNGGFHRSYSFWNGHNGFWFPYNGLSVFVIEIGGGCEYWSDGGWVVLVDADGNPYCP